MNNTLYEGTSSKYIFPSLIFSLLVSVKKPIRNLSGGQKARVVLVSLQADRPHILLLDEPTNHLDIETIEGLIDGINKYDGGVIIVSHDAKLITETNCALWVCKDKTVKRYNGDYEDYKDDIIREINSQD